MGKIRLGAILGNIFGMFFSFVSFGYSLSPMNYFNSLVAGSDDPGYQDGDFSEARFNQPEGLAFDDLGNRLFVADTDNHCIRVIYLDENNRVETLVGMGAKSPGKTDGNFADASFNLPSVLATLPENRLAVYEIGNHQLRMVDLKARTVTTLAGNKADNQVANIWSMVYRPADNSLYFTEPDAQKFQKLDLKSLVLTTVLQSDARIPHPMALCLFQKSLILADQMLPDFYEVGMSPADATGKVAIDLVKKGSGEKIQELTSQEETVYALQAGDTPLAQIYPRYQPVTLATPWGFMLDNENPGVEPFLSFQANSPVGFAASPREDHKLYLTQPFLLQQAVLSVKDYDFETKKRSALDYDLNNPTDFNYPVVKPPKTFRIMILGDSRVLRASAYTPGLRKDPSQDLSQYPLSSLRMNTFPKQLEFLLNREAALSGLETHFEVIVYARSGSTIPDYINYLGPMFSKYDVDLVLALVGWPGYKKFFEVPLTGEGIPVAGGADPEYMLKPQLSRIPPGAPERFYKWMVKKKIIKEGDAAPKASPDNPMIKYIFQNIDAEARNDLLEMDGLIFERFLEKFEKLKTSSGGKPQFILCYAPWRDWRSLNDFNESYWKELCVRNKVNFLDLCPGFNVLKPSFYPTEDSFLDYHYNVYGHDLLAYLLSYYLTERNWIPFKAKDLN